jgi:hypothetical protein
MILDVPTSDELAQAGTNILNLAWATDQPYRQISSSMRIRSQPGLAGRGVCAAKRSNGTPVVPGAASDCAGAPSPDESAAHSVLLPASMLLRAIDRSSCG